MLLLIASIALFQIAAMEFMIIQIMRPTFEEMTVMAIAPGPVVNVLLGSFMVITYLYVRPLPLYLKALSKGQTPDLDHIRRVHDRGLNYPYFMAFFALPFYMVGGYWGTKLVCKALEWPERLMFYGFLGGIMSALLAAPMSIYAYHWLTEPVIQLAAEKAKGLSPARQAGWRIPVRAKLIVSIFTLVMAVGSYFALVAFSQVDPQLGRAVGAGTSGIITIYWSLLAVASALALILAVLASNEITRPFNILQKVTDRVSRGEYDQPVRLVGNDETVELGAAFNRMLETIREQMDAMTGVVGNLRGGIEQVDEAVNTILSICSEQSTGATEQASAVQESSSIAEEIVATARQIAGRARAVDDVASSSLSACQDGESKLGEARSGFEAIADQVRSYQAAMKELEDRFLDTYKIVEWIEDVSEQTELLALNAALEAAGAGVEGKRFQVVAQANRRLALRSEEAAKEIRSLIETIQTATLESMRIAQGGGEKISSGSAAITAAVKALNHISGFARSTSTSVKEITMSTDQQSQASEQLASSIDEVRKVARKVEDGAHQIENAISELRDFADSLRQTVEVTIKRR